MQPDAPRDRSSGGEPSERSAQCVSSSTLGFQVVITFALLTWVGVWADGRFGWQPWGTLGGVALGLVSMLHLFLRESGTLKSVAEREAREAAALEAGDLEAGDAAELRESDAEDGEVPR